jgi:hypothetical protein
MRESAFAADAAGSEKYPSVIYLSCLLLFYLRYSEVGITKKIAKWTKCTIQL